jgi:hypothetical protein
MQIDPSREVSDQNHFGQLCSREKRKCRSDFQQGGALICRSIPIDRVHQIQSSSRSLRAARQTTSVVERAGLASPGVPLAPAPFPIGHWAGPSAWERSASRVPRICFSLDVEFRSENIGSAARLHARGVWQRKRKWYVLDQIVEVIATVKSIRSASVAWIFFA